jgi:N-acetylneuraminic acid mutarotase
LEGRVFDEIYSYSISSDKIELIGRLPHPLARGACAVSSSRKQLFYAGGKNKDGELVANIYSFDIGNKTSVEIGEEAELRFIGRATQVNKTTKIVEI